MKLSVEFDHTYMTRDLLNKGQSRVNVSYSPPSPQIFNPYFSLWKESVQKSRNTKPKDGRWSLIHHNFFTKLVFLYISYSCKIYTSKPYGFDLFTSFRYTLVMENRQSSTF
jgi:hypothetical protein